MEGPDLAVRTGWLLAILCSASSVLSIDFNVVNIANATIERDLHFNPGNLQWTVTAYGLTFGGFLLLGGRMADVFDRRRMFLVGIAGFGLTSLMAGAAHSATELIAARAAQGFCAALISPTVLSLLASTFPEGRPRQRAYGMWATAGSIGGLTGLLFGGIITSLLGWRWIFFINVPISILVIVMAASVVPKALTRAERRPRLDVPGAITVTLGIGFVIYGLGEAQSAGWGSMPTVVTLAGAPLLLFLFYLVERRSTEPLLPFALLRRRAAVANVLSMFQQSGGIATVFLIPLFMQQVWGYHAFRAGLGTFPFPLGFGIGARISSRVVGRFGARTMIVIGFSLVTIGCVWLAAVPLHPAYFTSLFPPAFIRSVGQGLVVVPITLTVTGGVRREDQGIAAGLLNMGQQLGGSLGLAAIATVAAAATTAAGGGLVGEDHGIRTAILAATLLPLLGATIAFFALKRMPGPVGPIDIAVTGEVPVVVVEGASPGAPVEEDPGPLERIMRRTRRNAPASSG